MFKLRPHHGICIGFFQGKGYSKEFTEHMTDTIKYLEENNPKICITASTDEICKACPNNIKGQCNGDEKVSAIELTLSAITRFTRLAPNAAMIATASRISGMAYSTSSRRMMILSVRLL